MTNETKKGRLTGRAGRYAKVAGAALDASARLAGHAVRGGASDEEKAVLLRRALGGLKGPMMKVAQFLSSVPDLIPDVYARELAQLQADAPAMGWPFVRRRMQTELGRDWPQRFESFEPAAAAAASLGQVHRARALDGSALACKLQYPDMESVIEADLRQLKLILKIFEHYDRAVDTTEVYREIAQRLHEEKDYAREGRHLALYAHLLRGEAGVHVPRLWADLSTDRLLTMDWLEGQRFQDVADTASQEARDALAIQMFRAWYVPFYGSAVIHGDPHMGNYTIAADGTINLLDFGCIRIFPPELVQGVMLLYESLEKNKPDLAAEAYRLWGFVNPSKALIDILNIWARFLYAPILSDQKRPIEETNTGAYGRATARKIHEELRHIGGVTVPRAFVFMDRAAVGMGAVFLRLRACVNWYRLFHDLIGGPFDVDVVSKKQQEALTVAGLTAPGDP